MVKNPPANARDVSPIPGLGRSPGEGSPGEVGSTHSSILAWRIPWTEEPGGLLSPGSKRGGQDWACTHTVSKPLYACVSFLIKWSCYWNLRHKRVAPHRRSEWVTVQISIPDFYIYIYIFFFLIKLPEIQTASLTITCSQRAKNDFWHTSLFSCSHSCLRMYVNGAGGLSGWWLLTTATRTGTTTLPWSSTSCWPSRATKWRRATQPSSSTRVRPTPVLPGCWNTGCLSGSVQSLSCVRLSATPWTAARQASLSITNSRSLLKLMPIESVMPSNHLILRRPLLLPP